ncbi:hypothetical protein MMC07_002482 [Pseudocyphellaria aurata]|nr:hypothetical protein [Pseudocyphellaria aurata]
MESLPQLDAEKMSRGVEDREPPPDSKTSSRSSDINGKLGSPLHTVPKTPPKNGIPPKRRSNLTNRRPAATSAASSRTNASTSSHTNPGTGLSKPPTRPLASSSARRPANGITAATAATAASSGHNKKPSVTSFDSKRKSDESASEENTKPSAGQSEDRAPRPEARKPATNWAPASSKNPFPPSSNGEKGQQNTGSPTKTILRSATNSSRPTVAPSTSHTNRPITSSARTTVGASGLDTRKKRLSTIPASPAVQRSEAISSNQGSSTKPAESSRPALVTRRSTMAVTIEQRLREMELVHQMLQVAMAEDGDESDEVKEEYGKRVDESLASLRTKLQEARRNEGLEVVDEKKNANAEAATASAGMDESTRDVENLSTALGESQLEEAKLNIELAALQSKVLKRYVHPDEVLSHITETTQRIQANQEDAEKFRATHTSEVEGLIASHNSDVAASEARLDAAEARLTEHPSQSIRDVEEDKRVTTLSGAEKAKSPFDTQLQNHATALKSLERQLADERSSGRDAASRIQNMHSELAGLQDLLSETKQRHNGILQQRDDDHLEEKRKTTATKDQEILGLHREIELLKTNLKNRVEEATTTATKESSALQSELATLRKSFDNLEALRHSESITHSETLTSKDREIASLERVVEDLQNLAQQMHEAKEKAVDEAKIEIIQEHDKIISDLRQNQRKAMDAMALAHEKNLEIHRKDQSLSMDKTESTMAELKSSLEHSESALEAAKVSKRETSETIDALKRKVRALEQERDEAQISKISMEDAFQQASSEILNLKKTLETIGSESHNKDEQHQLAIKKMKDEMESIAKALEDESTERSSYSETLAEELKTLRQSHAVDLEEAEKSKAALQNLQHIHDELSATSGRAEKERSVSLEKVMADHNEALEKHAQDLKDLKTSHSKKLDELKNHAEKLRAQEILSINSSHADKTAKAEQKYQRDVDELQQQHEKNYVSLRKDLETAEREKTLLATAHDAALSNLQAQLDHHRQLLIEAEQHSRRLKEIQDDGSSAAKFEELNCQLEQARAEVEQARAEVGQARAEVTQVKEEVAHLVAAAEEASQTLPDTTESDQLRQEISELINHHAAEISKIHENIELESERREKERKQGAEVRDRLVAESERLRHELLDTIEMAKEHQGNMHISAAMLQEANQKLSTARHVADRHKSEHRKALEELSATQGQLEELRSAHSQMQMEAKRSPDINQEFEALKIDLVAEREHNAKLEERLREAQAIHNTRVREMESALKVTTAELVELKTERPNGTAVVASPTFKSGLRSSRWAVMDNGHSSEGDAKEGEDLGSHIEGNMAGMQEQVRQIEVLNDDMIDESQRFLSRIQETFWAATSDLAAPHRAREIEEEVL